MDVFFIITWVCLNRLRMTTWSSSLDSVSLLSSVPLPGLLGTPFPLSQAWACRLTCQLQFYLSETTCIKFKLIWNAAKIWPEHPRTFTRMQIIGFCFVRRGEHAPRWAAQVWCSTESMIIWVSAEGWLHDILVMRHTHMCIHTHTAVEVVRLISKATGRFEQF